MLCGAILCRGLERGGGHGELDVFMMSLKKTKVFPVLDFTLKHVATVIHDMLPLVGDLN